MTCVDIGAWEGRGCTPAQQRMAEIAESAWRMTKSENDRSVMFDVTAFRRVR